MYWITKHVLHACILHAFPVVPFSNSWAYAHAVLPALRPLGASSLLIIPPMLQPFFILGMNVPSSRLEGWSL